MLILTMKETCTLPGEDGPFTCGRTGKTNPKKQTKNGMMQNVEPHVLHLSKTHGVSQHTALRKLHKRLIRSKQCVWQRRAEEHLCQLAHRISKSFWRNCKGLQCQHNKFTWQEEDAWKEAFQAPYKASNSP